MGAAFPAGPRLHLRNGNEAVRFHSGRGNTPIRFHSGQGNETIRFRTWTYLCDIVQESSRSSTPAWLVNSTGPAPEVFVSQAGKPVRSLNELLSSVATERKKERPACRSVGRSFGGSVGRLAERMVSERAARQTVSQPARARFLVERALTVPWLAGRLWPSGNFKP